MVFLTKVFVTVFVLTLGAFIVGQNLDSAFRPVRTQIIGRKIWRCSLSVMIAEFLAFLLALTWGAPY